MRWGGLLFSIIGFAAAEQARAAEWALTNRYNVGPDVRWWTGTAPSKAFGSYAVSGVQIVTNYGSELKFDANNAFAVTMSADSGYLWTQSKRVVANPRNPYFPTGATGSASDVVTNYSADGPLDIFLGGRLDLKVNSIVQPYVQLGVNRTQKTALTTTEQFAFSKDGDRDLRGKFGAGNFYELRSGSIINLNNNLAFDVYWKRNFGTEYQTYAGPNTTFGQGPSGPESGWDDGNSSITARLEYTDNKVTLSGGYQETWFKENGYETVMAGSAFVTNTTHERWVAGRLMIWNAKGEYRFDDNWFAYAEGSFSRQDANSWSGAYFVGSGAFGPLPVGPLAQESRNSNPDKYSTIAGIGYYTPAWTVQVQGIYARDRENDYQRINPQYLPDLSRYGGEFIFSWRPTAWGSLQARFGYLHVTGLGPGAALLPASSVFPAGVPNANPGFDPADIYTIYLTGRIQFAAQ